MIKELLIWCVLYKVLDEVILEAIFERVRGMVSSRRKRAASNEAAH